MPSFFILPRRAVQRSVVEIGFFALVTLLLFLCDFPGMLSSDSYDILWQAVTGRFYNWHSSLMIYGWHLLGAIYPGPAPYLAISLFLTTLALYWILRLTLRMPLVRSGALVFLLFFPANFIIAGWVTKDSLFRTMMLLSFALVALAVLKDRSRRSYYVLALAALLGLFITVDLRPDAIAAVFPLFLWLLCPLFFPGEVASSSELLLRIVSLGAIGLALTFLTLGLTKLVDTSISGESLHPEQVIMLDDIAAISVLSGKNLMPPDFLLPGATLDLLKARDFPWNFEYLYRDPSFGPAVVRLCHTEADFKELRATWLSSMAGHPLFYLQHRFLKYRYLLGLTVEHYGSLVHATWPEAKDGCFGLDSFQTYVQPNFVNGAEAKLYTSKLFALFRRPFVYLVLILACLFSVIRSKGIRPPLSQLILVLSASSCLHMALLFIVGTSADSRFAAWVFFAATLSLALVLGQWIESKAAGKSSDNKDAPFKTSLS